MLSMICLNTVILVIFFQSGICNNNDEAGGGNDFGANLVSELRNDANLDLSADEEYEDLRAELLAYHTTLAKLSDASARRSMKTTPCWQMGGICITDKLCRAQHGRYLTEVLGCRDNLNVCCFAWNRFKVKDIREHGIDGVLPWSIKYEAGGRGIVSVENVQSKAGKKTKGKLKQAIKILEDTNDDNQREVIANGDNIREGKIVTFDGNELSSSLSSEQSSSSVSNLDNNPIKKEIKLRNNRHRSTANTNDNALALVLKGIKRALE